MGVLKEKKTANFFEFPPKFLLFVELATFILPLKLNEMHQHMVYAWEPSNICALRHLSPKLSQSGGYRCDGFLIFETIEWGNGNESETRKVMLG